MSTVRESKISQTRAQEEAKTILTALKGESANGKSIGLQLCDKYSLAPRKTILSELQTILLANNSGVDGESLSAFLFTQTDGVQQNQFDQHISLILKIAAANANQGAAKSVADLILWIIASSAPLPRLSAIPGLSKGMRLAFAILTKQESAIKGALNRWSQLAQPLMNCLDPAEFRFSADEAAGVLNNIAKIQKSMLPSGLLACVPSLVLMAKTESASFLASPNGRQFLPLFSGMADQYGTQDNAIPNAPVEPVNRVVVSVSPEKRLAQLLKDIDGVFKEVQAAFSSHEEEMLDKEKSLGKQVKRLEQEIEIQKDDLRKLKIQYEHELATVKSELETRTNEKAEVEKAVKGLNADLRLTDENAARNLAEQKFEIRNQISRAIEGPLQTLARAIQAILDKNPTDQPVEDIAISFDAMHRKLIRELDLQGQTRVTIADRN